MLLGVDVFVVGALALSSPVVRSSATAASVRRRCVAAAMSVEPVVDLRSDTVTTPTPSMRKAMAAAEVGDDVFGDDPTVHAVERRIASMFEKEGALFVPTGTMGNLIAIMAHTWERGSEYVVGDAAHVYIFEQGGAAQFGGAHPRALATQPDGTIGDAATVCAAIRTSDQHFPITRCVALENTHNLMGGKVLPMDYTTSISEAVHDRGVAMHLDGARVWHAAEKLGVSLAEAAQPFDSLSVCMSKALGGPAGSLVVGDAELIARARRLRKGLGGTMRQTGVLAAAALVALDEILPTLGTDREHAATLASGLAALNFAVEPPDTNLLYFSLSPGASHAFTASQLVGACAREGIRFLVVPGSDPNRMRMVCHHQVDAAGVQRTLDVIGKACADPEWVTAGDAGAVAGASYAGGGK